MTTKVGRLRTTARRSNHPGAAQPAVDPLAVALAESQRLLHELQVHQIELESRNQELRQLQGDLETARDRYAELYDFAPVGYLTLDRKGCVVEINLAGATLLSRPRSAITGRPLCEFVLHEDRNELQALLVRVRGCAVPITREVRLWTGGGDTRCVRVEVVSAPGSDECRAVLVDVSERRRAEEHLARMVERFDLATHAARLGVWDWDVAADRLVWDDRMYELYGVRREDFCGAYEAWIAGLHPDDVAAARVQTRLALTGEKDYDTSFRVVWPDGSVHHIRAFGHVVRDAAGTPVRMTGINLDVTAAALAQEHLRASEQRYRSLFEHMDEGYAHCRMEFAGDRPVDFVYLDVNAAFGRITGLTNVVGRRVSEVIPGFAHLHSELLDTYARVARSGRAERFETWLDSLAIHLSVSVYCPEPGEFVAVFDNTTQRKLAERSAQVRLALLTVLGRTSTVAALLESVTALLADQFDCEAVGIRLRHGDDFPYCETRGFPPEFVAAERDLCARDASGELCRDTAGNPVLECMCGNVLAGRFDATKPFFTAKGSFWTNSTTGLLATTSEADRQARTRNRCNGEGYESVALIPLHAEGATLGLLQLNDRRTGRFSPWLIDLAEQLADRVALALAHRLSEEARRTSEEKYRLLHDSMRDGFVLTSMDGRITDFNEPYRAMLGYDDAELRRLTYVDLTPSTWHAFERRIVAEEIIARGYSEVYEKEYRRKDGTVFPVELRTFLVRDGAGAPTGMWAVVRDLTERKRAQEALAVIDEQLRQAQKMETIGNLAGGVAHDFNNLLQAMTSLVDLVRLDHSDAAKTAERLDEIAESVQRGMHLTRQLLLFSRRGTTQREKCDLNDVVRAAMSMLRHLTRANVAFHSELHPAPLIVEIDQGQFEQVLSNLVVNASDAMPDGGTLTVRTGAHPDGRVWFAVADTGHGIPAEIRARIFEPFFTTKGLGRGTGLGLAVVHGIVTRHSGTIEVESTVGSGTTIRVNLPSGGAAVLADATLAPASGATVESGHGERVLIVEDEAHARALLEEILTSLGYEVVAVESGEEAGSLPVEPPFDLLLTDFMLPGINGTQLAKELGRRWPELRVILMSGYTEDVTIRREVDAGLLRFLQKPFDMATLAKEVRAALTPTPT